MTATTATTTSPAVVPPHLYFMGSAVFHYLGPAFAVLLFVLIRPLSVLIGLVGSGLPRLQIAFIAWFGIRGIGSLYYLTFAVSHAELPNPLAAQLSSFVITTVALSIIVHGISVTPLMDFYARRRDGGR